MNYQKLITKYITRKPPNEFSARFYKHMAHRYGKQFDLELVLVQFIRQRMHIIAKRLNVYDGEIMHTFRETGMGVDLPPLTHDKSPMSDQ